MVMSCKVTLNKCKTVFNKILISKGHNYILIIICSDATIEYVPISEVNSYCDVINIANQPILIAGKRQYLGTRIWVCNLGSDINKEIDFRKITWEHNGFWITSPIVFIVAVI